MNTGDYWKHAVIKPGNRNLLTKQWITSPVMMIIYPYNQNNKTKGRTIPGIFILLWLTVYIFRRLLV